MTEPKTTDEKSSSSPLLKGDQSRFVDYSFGNVQTQNLEVTGNLILSSIATGSPLDGATLTIPATCSVVILQNTSDYTQLTINMPFQPQYGQMLTIICNVNIPNVTLANGTFGTTAPQIITANIPLRFIYAGSWFNC